MVTIPRLIVLDIAGTLLDDGGAVLDAFRVALLKAGIEPAADDLNAVRGANKLQAFRSFAARSLGAGPEAIRAAQEGLAVSLSVRGTRHAPGAEWLDSVVRRAPTGIILLFADVPAEGRERLKARGIPYVIIDPAGDPAEDIPSVGSANWSGGLAATRHLLELGHRRIAAITGPETVMCALARLDGYTVGHVQRALNADADRLSNVAIDGPDGADRTGVRIE